LVDLLLPDVIHFNPKLPVGFTFAAQNGCHPGDGAREIAASLLDRL
jgi:hypothetical protein